MQYSNGICKTCFSLWYNNDFSYSVRKTWDQFLYKSAFRLGFGPNNCPKTFFSSMRQHLYSVSHEIFLMTVAKLPLKLSDIDIQNLGSVADTRWNILLKFFPHSIYRSSVDINPTPETSSQHVTCLCSISDMFAQYPTPPKPRDKRDHRNAKHVARLCSITDMLANTVRNMLTRLCSISDMFAKYPTPPPPPRNPVTRESTEEQRKPCDAFSSQSHRHVCKDRAQHVDAFVFYLRHVCKIPHLPTPRNPVTRERAQKNSAKHVTRLCSIKDMFAKYPTPPKPRGKRDHRNTAPNI